MTERRGAAPAISAFLLTAAGERVQYPRATIDAQVRLIRETRPHDDGGARLLSLFSIN